MSHSAKLQYHIAVYSCYKETLVVFKLENIIYPNCSHTHILSVRYNGIAQMI